MTPGVYDPILVATSVIIAMFASYTALALANGISAMQGRLRAPWLAGGSLAMGFGIWSMHFVGMLAFRMPGMSVGYDVPRISLSLVVAVIASAIALYVVTRHEVQRPALAIGGLAMGAAICGMHYIGIAGMHMAARVTWDGRLVATSVLIAIGAAYAALWIAFRLRGRRAHALRMLGAVVMGIAIAGMHYTGMSAMRFTRLSGQADVPGHQVLATSGLALMVSAATMIILTIALVGSMALVQRELERQTARAEEQAALLRAAERRAREEGALRKATEALTSAFTVHEVMEQIARSALDSTAADGAFVESADTRASEVIVTTSIGECVPPAGLHVPHSGSFTQHVSTGEAFFRSAGDAVPWAGLDDHLIASAGLSSVIAVPLAADTTSLGALVLVRRADRESFRSDETATAVTFAHLASLAFRRVQLIEEAENRRQQLEVAERLAALGRVASTIAHEFNNVLMSIQAFHQVTRRVGTFEQYMKTAPQIDRAILRGKTVTDAVLRLTRASLPAFTTVDFTAWLQAFRSDLVSLLPADIEVTVACEPDLFIVADVRHLEQILVNLTLNARDAMSGVGKLTVTAVREGRDEQAMLQLTVADTGSGMTEEVLRRVFEPLFTTRRLGTGLGLAIVHEVVRAHGGSITVESTPGQGTLFRLSFKIAPPAAAETSAPANARATRIERIGLVEDDDVVAEGMTLLLELSGFEVRRVSLGSDAVPMISEFHPDAVVLDVGLPDMDGLSVYHLLEKHAPNTPVVFATGHADETLLDAITNLPHVGFLRKPFESAALVAAIEMVVAGKFERESVT